MNTERWIPHRPEYYIQTGGMHENPYGVPKDEIVRMILENPAEVVAQVVFGKYVESSGLVFTGELIQRMIDRSLPRVLGNFYCDEKARDEARVLLTSEDEFGRIVFRDDIFSPFHTGVDYARQTDFTVITTIDTRSRPARVVYFKRLNRVPWETIYTEVGIARMLWGANILGDSTGMGGDVVLDALHSRQFCTKHKRTSLVGSRCMRDGEPIPGCDPEEYLLLACVEGEAFQTSNKRELVEHLRNVMGVGYDPRNPESEFGWLRTPPIVQLEEELSFYAWDDKKLVTDCLFSLALAVWSGLEDPVQDASYGSVYGD